MKLFTEHPASVGETYAEHLIHAAGFGLALLGAGLQCLIHAVVPFVFVTGASRTIARLHERMVTSRARSARGPRVAHERRAPTGT